MKLFSRNLSPAGRVVRGLAGVASLAAAGLLWPSAPVGAILMGVAALFLFFEALRGWCVVRACGIRTPL